LITRLKADATRAQAEKRELEAKLKDANAKRTTAEADLQDANIKQSLLDAEIAKLNAKLHGARSHHFTTDERPMVSTPRYPVDTTNKVSKEMQRIEALLESTKKLMDDPEMELSAVMRKSNECKELESYLRGIRFANETDIPSK